MEGSYLLSFLKMIFALIFVLGIMLAAVYVLKRLTGDPMVTNRGGTIRVVAAKHVAPKTSIIIVNCLDRFLVLGVTPGSVNLLTELTESESTAIRTEEISIPRLPGNTINYPFLETFLGSIKKRRIK